MATPPVSLPAAPVTEQALLAAVIAQLGAQLESLPPVEAGEYTVPEGSQMVLDLVGIIRKHGMREVTPTTSIPTIAVLALACQRMGVQEKQFLETLEWAMTMALSADEKAAEYVAAFTKAYRSTERKIKASLAAMPKRKAEGPLDSDGLRVGVEVTGITIAAPPITSATVPPPSR